MSIITNRFRIINSRSIIPILVIIAVLFLAAILGGRASRSWLLILVGLGGLWFAFTQTRFSLLILIVFAMLIPITFETGTAIDLNLSILLISSLAGVFVINHLVGKERNIIFTRTMYPMAFFLILAFISLIIGNATWDPFVPRPDNLLLVQLGQIFLYFLSFIIFF